MALYIHFMEDDRNRVYFPTGRAVLIDSELVTRNLDQVLILTADSACLNCDNVTQACSERPSIAIPYDRDGPAGN